MTDFTVDDMIFRHCAPKPHSHFAPFWFLDRPNGGHLMFFSKDDIDGNIEYVKRWFRGEV